MINTPTNMPLGRRSHPRPVVLYIINVDWFFMSHFLPVARAAQEEGYECWVACQVIHQQAALEAAGLQVLPLPWIRHQRNIKDFFRCLQKIRQFLKRRPQIQIHAIGLEACLIAALASWKITSAHWLYAPTGLGYLAILLQTCPQKNSQRSLAYHEQRGLIYLIYKMNDWIRSQCRRMAISLLSRILRRLIRILIPSSAKWVFENRHDAELLIGLSQTYYKYQIVGGAGIDVTKYRPQPLPPLLPVRVACVARMIYTKGVDLLVDAVISLHEAGYPITLTLVGEGDAGNPASIAEAQLQEWQNTYSFIQWMGRRNDIGEIWAAHHVCCLASRGGEGLPKTLIEAAACGRPIITTAVPGCQDFVRHGQDGFVVPPEDVRAIAEALEFFLIHTEHIAVMGQSAYHRVIKNYSDRTIACAIIDCYAYKSGTMPQES